MSKILELLSYPFIVRALIVGTFVSFCAALLGVPLVLKRYSLIGHGLADIGFASLTIALAIGASPLFFPIPVVVIASFLIMYISQRYGTGGDVAIGIGSTGALALGVIVAARTKGFNIDVCNYMFGSIIAMNRTDMYLSIILASIVVILFTLFYNRLFLITYDEKFAKACGINVTFYQFLISFLTAITVAIGMRMMGTLLISSLLIFPTVISRRLTNSFRGLVITSAFISVTCFFAGMILSFYIDWPTGASIVMVNVLLFILTFLYRFFVKTNN